MHAACCELLLGGWRHHNQLQGERKTAEEQQSE
jgi:hypothetical protein